MLDELAQLLLRGPVERHGQDVPLVVERARDLLPVGEIDGGRLRVVHVREAEQEVPRPLQVGERQPVGGVGRGDGRGGFARW